MPEPLTSIKSVAAVFPDDNIDTDQIIPSREIKSAARDGLRDGLFANQRYLTLKGRNPNPDFSLNQEPFCKAAILVAGKNFGCGSSREHAVWALYEFGFRCLIAQSFGEIFHANCINNGMAPITLPAEQMQVLEGALKLNPSTKLSVDLQQQEISIADAALTIKFSLDDVARTRLLSGFDLISLTQQHRSEIDQFIGQDQTNRPWIYASRKEV